MPTMVVSHVLVPVRDQLNEASATAGQWSDTTFNYLIYDALTEMAMLGVLKERSTFTTTTTNTQTYSFPNNVLQITRLAVNGQKQQRIDERQLDILTNNSGLGGSGIGVPDCYVQYGISGRESYIDFYPIPDNSYPVMGWFDKLPSLSIGSMSSQSTLECPYEYAHYIQHYVLERSLAKEINPESLQRSQIHGQIWREGLQRIEEMESLRKSADRFNVVKDQDNYYHNDFGMV